MSKLLSIDGCQLENRLVFHDMNTFQVADTCLLCQVHLVAILSVELLQYRLNGQLLVSLRSQLFHVYIALFELFNELVFTSKQHQQSVALRFVAGSASYSVDIRVGVLGAVDLNNPVNGRKIYTSS